jgi:hypothetical protein
MTVILIYPYLHLALDLARAFSDFPPNTHTHTVYTPLCL